jgi:site-specific DNA-methyltransferase (adenine-specific)
MIFDKKRAGRNRTLSLTPDEAAEYCSRLLRLGAPTTADQLTNRTICQDLLDVVEFLPDRFVDLLIIDPPYNMGKAFHQVEFKRLSGDDYVLWLETWFPRLLRTLKRTASVYICSEWRSSAAVATVAQRHCTVRNRITWEREKGRGASKNWKNCSEDIWFCTMSDQYTFNVDAVKLRRRVIAPYRDGDGNPKDWNATAGEKCRLTCPSNLWTDITVPFWSMPENTDHPTQKPEKLIAKLMLASSNPGDMVLDPFLGSGTTSVVAKKLGRRYLGIELDEIYCCLAEKRLELAEADSSIQGYHDGVFWERNSLIAQKGRSQSGKAISGSAAQPLFGEEA